MVYREALTLQSNDKICTFHDVTEEIRAVVRRSGIKEGIVSVYSHHTTCSIVIQEDAFDMSMTGLQTLQQDFVDIFDTIIPVCKREGMYLHPQQKALDFALKHGEDARGCHNTDAHLRSALIGRSESVALIDGSPDLGDFGKIYFIDFDQTRARKRTVQVTVLGEK
ncbi:YjbQ family protein [Treponema sp. OMZ 840]|uniref:secondary thiamine-phosphate synthase enzyme YjbQ n=1 Tax=Treponema sp. OMZ 840 TaxID=244313 RepID=UPI003D91449C